MRRINPTLTLFSSALIIGLVLVLPAGEVDLITIRLDLYNGSIL